MARPSIDVDSDSEHGTPDEVQEVVEFFKQAREATEKQMEREADDLRFQVADAEHQWDDDARANRSRQVIAGIEIAARPTLCVSTLDEPIQLQLNQEKAAHLGITIHPLTEDATDDTAQVLQGLYRNIEVTSRAHLARSWAFDRAVKVGRGAYRVLTEYDPYSDQPGDQRIIIKRILYQETAYFDPFAEEPDWSDGDEAGVIVAMPLKKYKRKFKKSKVASFDESEFNDFTDKFPDWFKMDGERRVVMVAEYWKRTHDDKEIEVVNRDGETIKVPDPTNRPRVVWRKVNAVEVLEEQKLPGRYIPLIPDIGRELQPVNGERHFVGMIRPAKDGAKLTNFAASNTVELASYETRATWMMEEGQEEGHQKELQLSNVIPFPYIRYKRIGLSGIPGDAPQKIQADTSKLSQSLQLLAMGKDFVQSATGTFEPSLGKQTPAHRSGKAIEALQGQSVTANSNYLDNQAQITLPYEAIVVLDMIPYYYDREGRVVQILDDNNKPQWAMLNAPHTIDPNTKRPVKAQLPPGADPRALAADQTNPIKHYDLSKGRYGVSVQIAKSSESRLQEGQDEMGNILAHSPELMPIVGPVYFKFRDFPGAQQIAKLLEKVQAHDMPWLTEGGDTSAQQLQQAQMQLQQMSEQMQKMQADADKNRAMLAGKQIDAQTKKEITAVQERAESERAAMDREVKLAVAELGAKVDRMALFLEERARVGLQQHEAAQAEQDRAHEAALTAQTHAQSLEASDADHMESLDAAAQQAALTPAPAPEGESGI